MPITPSGTISIQDIMTELSISGATSMNDADVRGLIDKAAGAQMSMSEWYNAQSAFAFNLTSSVEANGTDLSTLATAAGWDGTVPIIMTVNSGVYVRSTSTAEPALTIDVAESEVINNGAIFGYGGNASGAGGHAIKINALSTIVTNNTGAFIAGGGGGGGGVGGGGGAGQSAYNTASGNGATTGSVTFAGGSTPNVYWSGCTIYGTVVGGTGGPQGGGGVTGTSYISGGCSSPSYFHNPPGVYAGERQQNGGGSVANNPAAGGSVLSATSNTDGAGSNGGGGWGRSGENGGGVGGDAINTGYSYTYTNNGTVYGSV
jgi:hypothetical protein